MTRRLIVLVELAVLVAIGAYYVIPTSRYSVGVAIAWSVAALLLALWALCARRGAVEPGGGTHSKGLVTTACGTLALAAMTTPFAQSGFTAETQAVVQDLMVPRVSGWEAERLQNNYYESLVRGGWFTSNSMEMRLRPRYYRDKIIETDAARHTPDRFVDRELLPNKHVAFLGKPFTTNRWGMRDRDYTLEKPEGVTRIAVVGPSHAMGLGVGDDETFETILERRLARRAPGRFEVLNFGLSDRNYLLQLAVFDDLVPRFDPDIVLFVSHLERTRAAAYLAHTSTHGVKPPTDVLAEITRKAGVERGMSELTATRLLEPVSEEILSHVVRELVARCKRIDAVPVWLFVPLVDWIETPAEVAVNERIAIAGGMVPINMLGLYDGHPPDALKVATFDAHPNGRGQEIIAERVLAELDAAEATAGLLCGAQ